MKLLPVYSTLLVLYNLAFVYNVQARPPVSIRPILSDSVGIEKKEGKRFILHRVDEGQTLYAISRRYGRPVSEIKAANPDMGTALRYGQLIRIPIPDGALSRKEEKKIDKAIKKQEKEEKQTPKVSEKEPSAEPVANNAPASDKDTKKAEDPAKAGIHVVRPGQTLYRLAGLYGVSQSDLRKWNNLSGNNVLIGQALIVTEKAYQDRIPTAPTPATPPTETPAKPVSTPPAETHTTTPRPSTPAEPKAEPHSERPATASETGNRSASANTKPVVEVESPRPGNDAPMPTRGRRISTSGVAEMIDGTDGSGKYMALHRTAPIGTLVQVRNEFNNQSMWVKVVGRLPNTGVNDKILIKLSSQAFTKLSPEDRRFRAEVSYIAR